jgi:hypothetical protein
MIHKQLNSYIRQMKTYRQLVTTCSSFFAERHGPYMSLAGRGGGGMLVSKGDGRSSLSGSNGNRMEVGDMDGQFGYEGVGAVHTGGWHSILKVVGPCVNISVKKIS